jgi:probable HAF family extracellular repeat protein
MNAGRPARLSPLVEPKASLGTEAINAALSYPATKRRLAIQLCQKVRAFWCATDLGQSFGERLYSAVIVAVIPFVVAFAFREPAGYAALQGVGAFALAALFGMLLTGRTKTREGRFRARLRLEALEDRLVPSYVVTDLDTLGGQSSTAFGISPSGLVVGYSETSPHVQHAFLYQDGVMQDLGTLGGTSSVAYAVNDAGQVAGYSQTAAGDTHAFLYSDGVMTDLGTFGGRTSSAFGINQSGQVTGVAYFPDNTTQHAFIYTPGVGMLDLGTLGSNYSEGRAINDSGQVAGNSATPQGLTRSFLYSDGVMTDLGAIAGQPQSLTYGLNNLGQVVGISNTTTGNQRAFLYTPGIGKQDIGTLGGGAAQAIGINDVGQVVGVAYLQGDTAVHAYLYQDGVMADLNDMIPPDSGWVLTTARGINNDGAIVGDGTNPNGDGHAFLLTPVEDPASTFRNPTSGTAVAGMAAALLSGTLRAPSAIPVGATVTVTAETTNATAVVQADGSFAASLPGALAVGAYPITYQYEGGSNFIAVSGGIPNATYGVTRLSDSSEAVHESGTLPIVIELTDSKEDNLPAGTYKPFFAVAGDPVEHFVTFEVQ